LSNEIEDTDNLDIIHYWNVVCLRKWWVIIFCLVVSGLAYAIISHMKPVYSATTQLLIETQKNQVTPVQDVYNAAPTSSYRLDPYRTQIQLLQSRQLLEKLIDRLGLENMEEFKPVRGEKQRQDWLHTYFDIGDAPALTAEAKREMRREVMVQQIKTNLKLENRPLTSLIDMTFESESPDLAAKLPNMLAQLYMEENLALRDQKIREATQWMQERTAILKEKFDKSQRALQQYVEKEKLVNLGYNAKDSGNTSITDELQDLNKMVSEANLNVSELSLKYGYRHPKLIAARQALTRAKNRLEQRKREFRLLGRKNIKGQDLKQKMEAAKALYEKFANRQNEVLEAATLRSETARVVEAAMVPVSPIKPKKLKLFLASVFGSLLFGVFLAILVDMLNSSIRTIKDVEDKLKQPVLGVLPILKATRGKHPNVASAMVDAVHASFAEAMASIRTGLVLSGLDNPHKVILVTSSIPNEGKTTAAISLAISLGKMEKVLLIDSDMRQPSINQWCSIDERRLGLSEFVAGSATLNDCIIKRPAMGIDLLSAGHCPPNPLELLSSDRLKKLLLVLENHYDRIIIDSPPVQAVSDSLVLAKYAKSVIYVVKADATRTGIVKAGLQRLQQYNAPITGIVLNQIDPNKANKYGEEFGGYFDHYGYGVENRVKAKA